MQTYRNRFTPVHRKRPGAGAILLACCLQTVGGAMAAEGDGWAAARTVDGVDLEARPAPSGFDEVRGRVRVCTDLAALQQFVGDPQRFDSWIPFTEEARALPADEHGERYYLRTSTPWPMRSRDLIYRIDRRPADAGGVVRIELTGVPDALPPQPGAVRMAGAGGRWTLAPDAAGVTVALRMTVNPGRVPALFANRRLAITVGRMLANLRDRFPCS